MVNPHCSWGYGEHGEREKALSVQLAAGAPTQVLLLNWLFSQHRQVEIIYLHYNLIIKNNTLGITLH